MSESTTIKSSQSYEDVKNFVMFNWSFVIENFVGVEAKKELVVKNILEKIKNDNLKRTGFYKLPFLEEGEYTKIVEELFEKAEQDYNKNIST